MPLFIQRQRLPRVHLPINFYRRRTGAAVPSARQNRRLRAEPRGGQERVQVEQSSAVHGVYVIHLRVIEAAVHRRRPFLRPLYTSEQPLHTGRINETISH